MKCPFVYNNIYSEKFVCTSVVHHLSLSPEKKFLCQGITFQGMRQKVFEGKLKIVLYLGSTQKGQIIMQNLAFSLSSYLTNGTKIFS